MQCCYLWSPLSPNLSLFSANRSQKLSHRERYGFHGFYFLFLFIYKYFVDTSFTFISCTKVDGRSVSCKCFKLAFSLSRQQLSSLLLPLPSPPQVFLYQGTLNCYQFPFIIMLIVGSVFIVALVIALPLYALFVVYRPSAVSICVYDLGIVSFITSLSHRKPFSSRMLWRTVWRRSVLTCGTVFGTFGGECCLLEPISSSLSPLVQ